MYVLIELSPADVTVILVPPQFFNFIPEEQRKEFLGQAEKQMLVQHIADADEVAEAYLFAMKYVRYCCSQGHQCSPLQMQLLHRANHSCRGRLLLDVRLEEVNPTRETLKAKCEMIVFKFII